jgi:hypothetical protein
MWETFDHKTSCSLAIAAYNLKDSHLIFDRPELAGGVPGNRSEALRSFVTTIRLEGFMDISNQPLPIVLSLVVDSAGNLSCHAIFPFNLAYKLIV